MDWAVRKYLQEVQREKRRTVRRSTEKKQQAQREQSKGTQKENIQKENSPEGAPAPPVDGQKEHQHHQWMAKMAALEN